MNELTLEGLYQRLKQMREVKETELRKSVFGFGLRRSMLF